MLLLNNNETFILGTKVHVIILCVTIIILAQIKLDKQQFGFIYFGELHWLMYITINSQINIGINYRMSTIPP